MLMAKGKLELMKRAFGDNPVETHPEPKTTMYDLSIQRDPVHSSRPIGGGQPHIEARGTKGVIRIVDCGLQIAKLPNADWQVPGYDCQLPNGECK